MQGGRRVCYVSEIFHGVVLIYLTYHEELYALVQYVKKWKNYMMGKDTIIHTDHQPLYCLQAQSKVQKNRRYKWMGFLKQFHLVIDYNKGKKKQVGRHSFKATHIQNYIFGNFDAHGSFYP
jgi:hypothetical protein